MTRISALGMRILRLLADEPRKLAALRSALSTTTAKSFTESAVEQLAQRGLIALKWGRWQLTGAGRRALPIEGAAAEPMRPYTPPVAAPCRPGSDHSGIPSLMGGREVRR